MPERVLLDSNVLYWFAFEPSRLSAPAASTLDDAEVELLASPFSVAEFALKVATARIAFADPVAQWVGMAIEKLRAKELPFTLTHAAALEGIDLHHRDPFDRMLLAQALAEDAAVVTSDRVFLRYPVRVIW